MTSIEVIGAGLPRTATLTQKLALEQLGFEPCYHWVNVLADLDQVELWHRVLDGEIVWQEIFGGFRSSVDWPGGHVYKQLIDVYPDAKVLLSVRDPEAWEPSFRDTIWTMCYGDSLMPLLSRARAQIDPRWRRYLALVDRMFWTEEGVFAGGSEPERLMEQMVAHNEEVKRVVPSERLLVWEVSEGWGPLCDFLGVDVPDGPLPHANERETFVERVSDAALDALGTWRETRASATR
jgi:hypothetical protein